MADIPDEFLDDWRDGHFPAESAREWMRDNAISDEASDVRGFLEDGLSLEWSMAAADNDLPRIEDWDHVTIHRDIDESWDVIISAGGETFTVEAANGDTIAQDQIWGDFWYDVVLDHDIPVERDFEGYGETN